MLIFHALSAAIHHMDADGFNAAILPCSFCPFIFRTAGAKRRVLLRRWKKVDAYPSMDSSVYVYVGIPDVLLTVSVGVVVGRCFCPILAWP